MTWRTAIVSVAGLTALSIGWFLWGRSPPQKACDLDPVIHELTAYRAEHGVYPTNLLALASIQRLATRRSLFYGERKGSDLLWDPFQVSANDLTVLCCTNRFTLFAPTGRVKLYSFSSFPVWKYESESPVWSKGRIHWSLLGTYWSAE